MSTTGGQQDKQYSQYQQVKNALKLPLKIHIYFNLLEYSLTENIDPNISSVQQGISANFVKAFMTLSKTQKDKFLLTSISLLYQEFKDVATIDEIQQDHRERYNAIVLNNLCRVKTQQFAGKAKIQTKVLGISYWPNIDYKINCKKYMIETSLKQYSKIDLRLYIARKSKQNAATIVLESASAKVKKGMQKISIAFKVEQFQSIFESIYACILLGRNEKLIQQFSSSFNQQSQDSQIGTFQGQKQLLDPDSSGIGISIRPLILLNESTINDYIQSKHSISEKLEKIKTSYFPIYAKDTYTIYKNSVQQDFYKLQCTFHSNCQAAKQLFLTNVNKHCYLTYWEVLESFSAKYQAVYQRFQIGNRKHDQIVIQENFTTVPGASDLLMLKNVSSFVNRSQIMQFSQFKIEHIDSQKCRLVIIGCYNTLLLGGLDKLLLLLEGYVRILVGDTVGQTPTLTKKSTLVSIQDDQFFTVLDDFDAPQLKKLVSLPKIIPIKESNKQEEQDQGAERTIQIARQGVRLSKKFSNKNFQLEINKAQTKAKDLSNVKEKDRYLFHKFQQNALPKSEVIQKRQKNGWLSDWKRTKGGKMVCGNLEKIQEQRKIYKKLIKSVGQQIFKTKGGILNLSLPVDLFKKQSHLTSIASTLRMVPLMIEKGLQQNDYLSSFNYYCTLATVMNAVSLSLEKPFNPILGQTAQYTINGCPLYMEQICHHPPISSYMFIGRGYRLTGTIIMKLDIGLNYVRGHSDTPHVLSFDDGTVIQFNHPSLCIGGLVLGERTFNFQGKNFVYDKKNNYFAELVFGQSKRTLFASSVYPEDEVNGIIYKVKSEFLEFYEKNKMKLELDKRYIQREVCNNFKGVWNQGLSANNTTLVTICGENPDLPYLMQPCEYVLPSDSRHREDLNLFIAGDNAKSQEMKVKMEQDQRRDKKLRQKNKD